MGMGVLLAEVHIVGHFRVQNHCRRDYILITIGTASRSSLPLP